MIRIRTLIPAGIMISAYYKWEEYEVQKTQYKEHIGLELASGSCVLVPRTTQITGVKPYDLMYDDFTGQTWMINTFNERVSRFKPSKQYVYTINFIDPAKLLQTMPLSNRSITQPMNATKRKVGDQLQLILDAVEAEGYDRIVIPNNVKNWLNNKDCPELSWNRPTLYEVCCDLLSQFDWIPTISVQASWHPVTKEELNTPVYNLGRRVQKATTSSYELDSAYFISEDTSNSIDNYANALDIELENAVSNKENVMVNGIGIRSDIGVISDSEMQVILEHPIYQIDGIIAENFTVTYEQFMGDDWYTRTVTSVDITSRVLSKVDYDLLQSNENYANNGKRNFLYFDGNKILGLDYNESAWWGGSLGTGLENTIVSAVKDEHYVENITRYFTFTSNRRDVTFNIVYQSMDSQKIIIKNDKTEHNVVLIDNQSDSYIDSNAFYKVKQENINYLGNDITVINAFYKNDNMDYCLPVGSTYEGKTVYERDYSFNQNGDINCVYYLSKDYPKVNRSMVLNQKKRYTQFASANDSFLRQVHINAATLTLASSGTLDSLGKTVLKISGGGLQAEREQAHIHTGITYFSDSSHSDYFTFSTLNSQIGKTILLSAKMYSNIGVGLKVADTSAAGGYSERMVDYTDDNGEVASIRVYLGGSEAYDTLSKSRLYPEKPIQSPPNPYYKQINQVINKDNREILGLSMQINFKDTDNYEIGEGMLLDSPFIHSRMGAVTLKAYQGNTIDNNVTITIVDNQIQITGLTIGVSNYYIKDTEGNVFLRFKKKPQSSSVTLYLVEA